MALSNRNPSACERNLSPQRGGTCSNCGRSVWPFEGVTADVEAQLIAHIRSGHTVNAIKLLRSISGRDLVDAKVDDRTHVRDGRDPFARCIRCRRSGLLAIVRPWILGGKADGLPITA